LHNRRKTPRLNGTLRIIALTALEILMQSGWSW
jgi:hypothetical protein